MRKFGNNCSIQSYSDEFARFLLYVTNLITHILNDENVYSLENLSTHNAMMKIYEAKAFDDQPYEIMKENYIEIQNKLTAINN